MKMILPHNKLFPLLILLFFTPAVSIAQENADYEQARKHYQAGNDYYAHQQWKEALDCMKEARIGFHKANDRYYEMQSIWGIATIEGLHLFHLPEALKAYNEAAQLADNPSDLMEMLKEQQKVCERFGEMEELWRVSEKMDSLLAFSDDPIIKYKYNTTMGDRAMAQKRYDVAERWYLNNETLLEQLPKSSYYYHYNNLRWFYIKTGNWELALKYAELAKQSFQQYHAPSPSTFLHYSPYVYFADIYKRKGDREKCFAYMDSLFAVLPFLEEPREISILYTIRAGNHRAFGEHDRAIEDFRTAYDVVKAKYGEDDADCIDLLPLLANQEYNLKNYEESVRLYRKNAEYAELIKGKNSNDYVSALDLLANAEAYAGHTESACKVFAEAESCLQEQIRSKWPYLTGTDREGYWTNYSDLLLRMTPFALASKQFQTPFTEVSYNGLVLSKAFLLASDQSTYSLIKNNGTKSDLDEYAAILSMQSYVKQLVAEKAHPDSILASMKRVHQLETDLTSRCRSYGEVTSFMEVDYQKVKQSLHDGNVLLDFTDFVPGNGSRVYAAYIIDNRQEYPLLKELFTESSIDSLNVSQPHQYYSGHYGDALYRLLWEPLKDYVKEGDVVFYVPSQFLFQIAPEALPAGDGSVLGDHYHFVRLSSARELVNYNPKLAIAHVEGRNDAVLYGDLRYDLGYNEMQKESNKYDIPPMLVMRGNDEPLRGDSSFHRLPGSKKEITSVAKELKKAGLSVLPFSGPEGTQESFVSLSGNSPGIIHLATHGFYYTPDEAERIDYLKGCTDAMSLSGLVLAGGNAAWLGKDLPDGVLGGILRASDIARMDLTGVEMVVLSACHSGKGEATAEGLYGLQRAFKKAGVKTIVMSLWAESDVVGPEFMLAFYKHLVNGNKWDKRDAFEKAKSEIRDKYPDMPSYWAGFVMLD